MDILKNRLLLLFIFILMQFPLHTEDLISLIEKEKAELLWDSLTGTGIIMKADSEIVFKLGVPWILCDYSIKYNIDNIKRDRGKIIVPDNMSRIIHEHFLKKEKEKETPRIAVILIDPGHGGKDPGAYYVHKSKDQKIILYEKDLTLKVSRILYELLKETCKDKDIILTRSTDEYLKLEERVEIANSIKTGSHEAIVYISIHFNASFNKKAKGFEVWYLPQNYRRTLIDDNEVPEDEKDIIPILNTLLEEEYTLESITLARAISQGLLAQVGELTEERGLKEESWFVVRNTRMPSVLLELGFISNKDEALLLSNDSYLKKLAKGVYNGICTFINQFESTKGFTK
ncbi:MAG: N-acetylmuramoyl-L-alanine amidase [Spirochaetales bacterium]|nr:N-acetylmuramoyl-L-alanine amidase [Spirochaetales bacterium]